MFTLLQRQIKFLRKWVNYHEIPFLTCKSSWWCEQLLRVFVPEWHLGLEGLTCNLCFHFSLFPESLLTPRLAPGRPFTGCIRHFVIDGRPVSFSKAALVSGAVSINSCPAAWHPEQSCPRTKFFRALKETQSQPGGTATFPPSGSLHLVEQDLNESSGNGLLLFLIWILTLDPKCLQWTTIKGASHLLALYYFLLVKLLFLFLTK